MLASLVSGKRRAPLGIQLRRIIAWLSWRYRYLVGFTVIGFLSIALEVFLWMKVWPDTWSQDLGMSVAFMVGLAAAFYGNAKLNFRVSRRFWWYSFGIFTLISFFSLALQLGIMHNLEDVSWGTFPLSRFAVSGSLFLFIYYLHSRFAFRRSMKNLGIAVYVEPDCKVSDIYSSVGDQCDHIHIDLVDHTFREDAVVDLKVLRKAKQTWPWHPFCAHLMTRHPVRWIRKMWKHVDLFLIHLGIEDDPMEAIAVCRSKNRLVGIVWNSGQKIGDMLPYLPHVDVVMVLGIEKPGYSGQPVLPQAYHYATLLFELANRYGFELAFDGGVNRKTIHQIPANIITSSSAVLQSENPIFSIYELVSGGGRHDSKH